MESLDNLFVSSHFYSENEKEQPDKQGDDCMDFIQVLFSQEIAQQYSREHQSDNYKHVYIVFGRQRYG